MVPPKWIRYLTDLNFRMNNAEQSVYQFYMRLFLKHSLYNLGHSLPFDNKYDRVAHQR